MTTGTTTHKCLAGCGKSITWRFAICSECEQEYGSKPEEWPEWLRFLWNDIQRERRQERAQIRFEADLEEYENEENKNGRVPRRRPGI